MSDDNRSAKYRKGRKGWCNHYVGLSGKTECAAGVKYADVTDTSTKPHSLPCLEEWNHSGVQCAKCEMPTPEEIAEHEREIEERCASLGKARAAIVAHLGGPWKRGTPGASGAIDCPVCGGKGTLHFSRAGYNGHVHAKCATADCVSWME